MPRIDRQRKKIVWCASLVAGILIVAAPFASGYQGKMMDEFVLLAVMAMIFPPSIANYMDYKWRKSIDRNLPALFRTIVQAQKTGMTLPQAIEEASKRDYGPLTKELKKINAQISWGMPLEEALQLFAKRVDTPLVQKAVPLIIEASRSGGRVEKIFGPLGKFVNSILMMEKERKTQTRPYIAIIYVAFYVFLFTIILLFKTFFVSIEGTPILGSAIMGAEETERLFFHMASFQAFFGGLIAGKMSEGSLNAGLKHSLVMLASAYLVFMFAL